MKNKLVLMTMMMSLYACGKSNNTVASVSTLGTIEVTTKSSNALAFEGNYDLIETDAAASCGANIQIIKDCNGYRVLSNNKYSSEDFCNVSGEVSTDRNPPNPDRNPPNPDRNPPNPDRNPPNPDRRPPNPSRTYVSSALVTQKGNSIVSVVNLQSGLAYKTSLTLLKDDYLVKKASYKNRNSKCLYLKR